MLKKSFAALTLSALLASSAHAALARPPQYVALAFDGSKSLPFWAESRAYAKAVNASGKFMRYTYFVNATYFISPEYKNQYVCPGKGAGYSAIGWGESRQQVADRLLAINGAFRDGHEIASHANAHVDAGALKWSRADWKSEFEQFNRFLFGAYEVNHLPFSPHVPGGWFFKQSDIVGFRAPQLGVTAGLWPTLEDFNFNYDTSRVATMNYWPEKLQGGSTGKGYWNFPLARIQIAGTGKTTLSMDYNFFVSQSGGKEDPANSAKYEQQMFESYMRYFQANYNGNRAPIHIGHHFSKWNGGAYWRAMKRFTEAVCGMPEVKCDTYTALRKYMDSLPKTTLAAYRKGEFDRSGSTQANFAYELPAPVDVSLDFGMQNGSAVAAISGADADELLARGAQIEWRWNGIPIASGATQVDLSSLPLPQTREGSISLDSVGSRVTAVFTIGGEEIATATRAAAKNGEGYVISKQTLEALGLTGDLPEAHID